MELFKLFGTVLVDTAKANESIYKAEKNVNNFGENLKKGITTVAKWGTAIVGGATAIGGAMLSVANSSADAMNEIDKMSAKIGFTTEAYQEWEYIAQRTGTTMEQLQGGITDLAEKIQDASLGTGEASEIFQALGVSVTDANGNLRDSKTVFEETIVALQGMENATDRQAYATKLMSTTGEELLPLLNGQIGSIDELKKSAHDLGLVMGDEAVQSGVEFKNSMNELKNSFTNVKNGIALEIMPYFTNMLNWAIEKVPLILEKFKEFEVIVGVAIDKVKGLDDWLKENETTLQLIAIAVGTLTTAIVLFNAKTILETGYIYALIVAEKLHIATTTLMTTVTTAFGTAMAFITSPITLVTLAIGSLIAIGVLLYKNWDEVKAFAVKTWNGIKVAITTPIENAKNTIRGIIDTIKSFFNFRVSFPHIPMPHFTIKPSGWDLGDLLKGSIPKLGISWYAKAMDDGMILESPTIFGYQNGKLLGGGEVGSETVVGTGSLMNMIQKASNSERTEELLEKVLSLLSMYIPQMATATPNVVLDSGVLVGAIAPKVDQELGMIQRMKERGR